MVVHVHAHVRALACSPWQGTGNAGDATQSAHAVMHAWARPMVGQSAALHVTPTGRSWREVRVSTRAARRSRCVHVVLASCQDDCVHVDHMRGMAAPGRCELHPQPATHTHLHACDVMRACMHACRNVACMMAAVLHDVIDDTSTELSSIAAAFGPTVANMVEKVSQLSKMNQLLRRGKRQGAAARQGGLLMQSL